MHFRFRSEFFLQDKEYDSWSAVADYVFQVFFVFVSPAGHSTPWWKNSNATSVLTHHRDLVGIREVGGTKIVNLGSSSSGRMACTTSHSYWLRTSHILLWTRTEVSFCHGRTVWVSFFQWGGSFIDKSQVNINREKIAALHICPFLAIYNGLILTRLRHSFTSSSAVSFRGKNIEMMFQTYKERIWCG